MNLTKTIEIDLTHPDRPKKVAAVEGDSYTRQVDIRLLSDSHIPWAIPKDVAVMISYVKPDRTAGAYDTLPDGTQAYSIRGNILSVMLAPQMLTAVGEVAVQIQLTHGDKMLSTFPFGVLVSRRIAADAQSEDYFNWRAQYLPQTVGAKVGQWLQITRVDEQGRVLAVEAVDAPEGGTAAGTAGGYYTPSITQPDSNTMEVEFVPSNKDMPAVAPMALTLPAGPQGPQGEKGEK